VANLLLTLLLLSSTERIQYRAYKAAPIIWEEAIAADVDPYLVAAIAWNESRLSPIAKSKTKDCGIMQVNTRWSPYTCKQLLNVRTCVKAGIRALLYWQKRFSKREPNYQWTCHYNSGNKCNRRSLRYARKVRRTRELLLRRRMPGI